MDIYGIIGFPVTHSLSPLLHNAAFKHLEMAAGYDVFEVEPAHLAEFFKKEFRKMPIKGLSVTIPHKIRCLQFLDEISDEARMIGAINTIKNDQGKLIGENYDWIGIKRAIEDIMEIRGKIVGICGAGGAARAAAFAVAGGKASQIIFFVRDPHKHQDLSGKFACRLEKIENFADFEIDILINTTPLGMVPYEEQSPVPAGRIKKKMLIFDAVYRPLRTKLIRDAQRAGAKVITGEKMLLYQAFQQFTWWTGRPAPAKEMAEALNAALYKLQ